MSDTVYLGNPNLKKANVKVEFTQENIEEFIKCKDNPVYFAKNYIKIVSLDEGLVNFNLYPFQEKLINNFTSFLQSSFLNPLFINKIFNLTCKIFIL